MPRTCNVLLALRALFWGKSVDLEPAFHPEKSAIESSFFNFDSIDSEIDF